MEPPAPARPVALAHASPARGRVLLVGAGGIGGPAALALCAAGVDSLTVVDDDRVELGNLHRQILFGDADVGRAKASATAEALRYRFPRVRVAPIEERLGPELVASRVAGHEVVLDATDNFATRFLLADACGLAATPVVHAAAVRWHGTVMAVSPHRSACYRCLFEEPPAEGGPDCSTAGIVGPVCGVVGALAAELALRALRGDLALAGRIVIYDGRHDTFREVEIARRATCPLCGHPDHRSIRDLRPARYLGAPCPMDVG